MIEANNQTYFLLFINSKSGGGLGQQYLTIPNKRLKFSSKQGSIAFVHLYDMCSSQKRTKGFEQIESLLKLGKTVNVIICGGDGTILWVIEEIIFFGIDVNLLNFGVIPIGTGNDFSRTIGWGGDPIEFGRDDIKQLKKIVKKWLKAEVSEFDLWQATITTYGQGKILQARQQEKEEGLSTLKRTFSNYLGLGIDARVSYRVQKNRTGFKLLNLIAYSCCGLIGLFKGSEQVSDMIDEFSQSDSQMDDSTNNESILSVLSEERRKRRLIQNQQNILNIKKGYRGLICLNCTSYMAGVKNVWQTNKCAVKSKPTKIFKQQKFNDGKVQFIAFKNELKLGLERFINSGAKVTQGEGPYRISFKEEKQAQTYVHIDGQAMKVRNMREIEIKRSTMVKNGKINVLINRFE